MKAKIENNQLIYPTDFMYISDIDSWVTNPTDEQLINNGFKEIIYQTGDNGFYETETNVIIETPEQILSNIEISEMRKQAYVIESDHLYMSYQKHLAIGETEKAELKRQEWIAKVIEIENRYLYTE